MSNKRRGPSLYYASDKNIFDALTNRRVDKASLAALFASRNTIISLNSPREELAKYFSRLTHDYFDHKIISEKLGAIPRRERIATMEIRGDFSYQQLKENIDALKKEEEEEGNIIQLSVDGENVLINIQYTEFDYKLAEFSQVRVRDGDIALIYKGNGHYVIRNTQNEYINSIKNNLLARLSRVIGEKLDKIEISLFSIQDVNLRSQFFYELISNDEQFTRDDVSRAYVYKAQPEDEEFGINEKEDDSDMVSSHIERVHLRGTAVTQSSILNDLTTQQYHIFRIQWAIKEQLSTGHVYEIEAAFENPRDCINFSFILRGVYPRNDEDGSISVTRRAPTQLEIEKIFNLIEDKAKKALEKIQKQASSSREKKKPS